VGLRRRAARHPPLAAAWAFAERTRWSSVVLAGAALVVAFLELRLLQIWGTFA
jgi:hypothetical protein